MSISMYQASIPVFLRTLHNLRGVLQKGEAHAAARGDDPDLLLEVRLAPDMYPLLRQVQIATDMGKNGSARLAGVDPLVFEDTETTFEQLHARIERAVDYIGTFTPEQIDGSEARPVSFMTRSNGEMKFDGQSYLLDFILPNLFFHVTTAYAILRHSGVELGKLDYVGGRG